MAIANPLEAFVWGAGGAKKTPEQVAREREIAQALMKGGVDYSPVDHWLQGAARAAQAGVGAFKDWRASNAEEAGHSGFQSKWDNIFGSGQTASVDPVASALMGAPQTASDATAALASVPSGDTAGYVRNGLIQRGLPEHVADAFLLNFQDESGFDPGINEAAPTAPGSRGGYGLYQLTGPRRVAYEQYAQQLGVDPSNVDAQLDFLMSELQGPEAAAAQAILSAPDTGTAAAAIVNKFLRPAEEHRARRAAQYMGGAVGNQQVAQALMGGGTGAGGASPSMQELIGLASDPWASDSQRSIINALVGQQLEQQAQASDPLRQLQIQAAERDLSAPIEVGGVLLDPNTYEPIFDSRAPKSPGLINAGDGKIYNPSTGEWITAPASPETDMTDTQRNLAWRAEQAGLVPGTPEYAEFMRSGGQSTGMALTVGPDGTVQFAQGAGAGGKPLTEGQSKDTVYATRAEGALPIIDALGANLTDLRTSMTGQTPVVGNFTKSPEYQQAEQAGLEFLQAILRKDTGAAITPDETAEYGKVYLPRPGDSPQLLEQKRISRTRALEAIKAGLPPQAILAQEQALLNSGAATGAPAPGMIEDGYRFKGGDPANPANWEQVQ